MTSHPNSSSSGPRRKHTVSVLGSLNIDFVLRVPRLPAAGETLAARSLDTGFGGKGANQAVACARLADAEEVQVQMVGNVGDDAWGREYLERLRAEGIVGVEGVEEGGSGMGVRRVEGRRTGTSTIIVEEETGENRILFVEEANGAFGAEEDLMQKTIGDVVVFQLEIPLPTVLHNLHLARQLGRHTILNPAPATPLPDHAYPDIDTLIMNETESAVLAQQPHHPTTTTTTPPHSSLLAVAKSFLSRGVRDAVIVTLGEKGLVYATRAGPEGSVPAEKAHVVDTTAAGDTFVGAYAVSRVRDLASTTFDYEAALRFATRAAGKTVERPGAMAAIPHRRELE